MNAKNVLAALTVALASGTAYCADDTRTPVHITAAAEEHNSKNLVFEVKEQFRSSSRLKLTISPDKAFYRIKLAVLDVRNGNEVAGVAYSLVWTLRSSTGLDTYSGHVVGVCPDDELIACARSILAATDEEIEEFAEAISEILEEAKQN